MDSGQKARLCEGSKMGVIKKPFKANSKGSTKAKIAAVGAPKKAGKKKPLSNLLKLAKKKGKNAKVQG